MTSFSAWIVPGLTFLEVVERIGQLFSIPLMENPTTLYDEYPAHEIELEDNHASVRFTLRDSPDDLENLIHDWPGEYSEVDMNYAVTVCIHGNLPLRISSGFELPYSSPAALATGLMQRLQQAGLMIYAEKLPYTNCLVNKKFIRVEYPVYPDG